MKSLKGKISNPLKLLPYSVRKALVVALFGVTSTLCFFGAAYVSTGEVNVVELRGALGAYAANVLLAYAYFLKKKESELK
jgi:hypothetical protein